MSLSRIENKNESSLSRYRFFDILQDDDKVEFLESWRDIEIPTNEDDNFHEVLTRDENRIDLIAYQYYQNTSLWWVIAITNELKNPFDLDIGTILRVPSINSLYGFRGVLS